MEKNGEIFKKIRHEKGFSLRQAANESISISLLSRFENGKSDISSCKLFNLLDNLGVVLDEFENMKSSSTSISFQKLLFDIEKFYSERNTDKLMEMKNQQYKCWLSNKVERNLMNYIMISCVIKRIDPYFNVHERDVNHLCEFLFRVEKWYFYELSLFGNILFILHPEAVISLSNEVIKQTENRQNTHKNSLVIVQISLNTIIYLIEKKLVVHTLPFVKAVSKITSEKNLYYENIIFIFLKGIINIENNDIDKGTKQVEQALNIFFTLEKEKAYVAYKTYFEDNYQAKCI